MSELYNRIDVLCKERDIDITKMCRELNISRSSLSELKSGRVKSLSTATLTKIADFFNVSVSFLIGKTEIILGTEVRALIKKISIELNEDYEKLERLYMVKELPREISYKALLYFFSVYLNKPLSITNTETVFSQNEQELLYMYRKLSKEGQFKVNSYTSDILSSGKYVPYNPNEIYRAAHSKDNHADEITTLTPEEKERVTKATRVTLDNENF